jgi:predicted nicotinamide N-methyase
MPRLLARRCATPAGAPPSRQASPAAEYRTQPVVLELGAAAVRLQVVSALEEHVDAAALLRDPGAPEPPYWMHLWPGSRALARQIAAARDWRGLRVADVGCGLGLAGLVAARLGARVVLVDAVLDALRLARWSSRLNGLAVEAVQSDVRRPGLRGPFDAVLLADVTYDPELQEALAELLAGTLAERGVGLCADSVRHRDPGFRRACERRGLCLSEREVRELDEGRPLAVRLAEVRRT